MYKATPYIMTLRHTLETPRSGTNMFYKPKHPYYFQWNKKGFLENLIPPINTSKTLKKLPSIHSTYVYDNIWTYTIIHTVLLRLSSMLLCDIFVFTPWQLNLDCGGTSPRCSTFVQFCITDLSSALSRIKHQYTCCYNYELHTITYRGRPPEYRTYMEANSKLAILLKWQCPKIFDFRFFSRNSFLQAPEYPIRAFSNFFENSRRYSWLYVHHRWHWHW